MLFIAFEAEGQSFRFEHLSIENGLSQSQPYAIIQDSYGYVWIGTQDGLNRFDGINFKVYKNDPFDSTTMTHNWVWSMQEDDHGDLWIGTYNGLCKYVRSEDRFIRYFHDANDPSSIGGNRTNYVIKDKKGRLWISSWASGISLYNETTASFTSFKNVPSDTNSISDNFVRSMFCDNSGVIWVGTWNGGLNRVVEDKKGIRFQRYNNDGLSPERLNRITSIAEDKQGRLWICTNDQGLILLDVSRNTATKVQNFPTNGANKVMSDRNGNMWIGTNNGLYFYNSHTRKFEAYKQDPANRTGISSDAIFAMMEDKTGIVWISGNGLDLYDPRKNSIKTYQNNSGDRTSLSENMTWSFSEDDQQNIWIGSQGDQVNIFNPRTKSFKQVVIRDGKGNAAINIYKMIFNKGIFWIASFGSGLIRYEKDTGKAKFFFGSHPSSLGKVSLVNELLMDEDQTIWIGTDDSGLLHFDPDTDEVIQYSATRDNTNGIASNQIKSIHQDNKGNIWICYTGAGIGMLNRKDNTFTNYRYDSKNIDGLSDQIAVSITQQNDSIFWICSHGGLNRLNVKTGKFSHFFEKDGLANNVIYEMLQDKSGNYWISSNGGISKFNPEAKTFKTYTIADGLQSNEFNSNAALKSSTGDFYFGGIFGFNVFKPEDIKVTETPPPLLINGYSIYDKTYLPQRSIELRYFENYITFSFSALEFSAPGKVKYAYKLDGFDKEWVQAGNEHQAHYTNLDHGEYVFRVKASNPDGYWTDPGASMVMTIHPAFWRTWWFTSLVILMAVAMTYMIHRYRLEQSLKVERLRNKIASDLHDEVGSSLSRISIYSDLLQNGVEVQERGHYLTGIGQLTREVVSTMSDIVWSIDNRHDTLGALVIRMKDFAASFLHPKSIELTFSTVGLNEAKILSPTLKQNIYLIFKESIHNIVKHAQAKHVFVTITNDAREFSMVIRDDGRGFSGQGDSNGNGNGLRNMQRRAETVHGTFHISHYEGTTLTLKRRAL